MPGAPDRRLASAVLFVLLALSAVMTLGCSPHLVGTNDAALEYVALPDPETGVTVDPQLAATRLKARLSAAQVFADVELSADGHRVRVVVDADAAGAIDSLALWRGGLSVYRASDAVGHAPPVAQLAIASIESAHHGRALSLTFAQSGRDALAALAADPSFPAGERVVLARDRSVLATVPLEVLLASPFILSLGDDIAAYTRAVHARLLLGSPVLPAMRRTAVVRLPPDYGLAVACAVLPFALSFGWLFFVKRFDRARPEPTWLVLSTFALGGLSVVPAGLVEAGYSAATPWLDPSVMTLGGQLWALPVAIAVFTLVVGVSEEGAKFIAAWSLPRQRREFDEPVDGIIYGCAAALGFAAVENVKYFALGRMSGVIVAVRAFVTVPAHLFFGAIWGYAMGRELVSRRTNALEFLALAALAHGAFDAILSIDGMQPVATLLVLVLAFAFVAMLRSALRHGAVRGRSAGPASRAMPVEGLAPASEPMPASDLGRAYFRVGSPGAFYACAAGIILSAFSLMVLGGAYEILHHRIGIVFVSLASAMLILFGFAAYGASETIPLDVAVDSRGVTLSGAQTPWSAIVGVSLETNGQRASVVLRTNDGVMRLGPASVSEAEAIAVSIRSIVR